MVIQAAKCDQRLGVFPGLSFLMDKHAGHVERGGDTKMRPHQIQHQIEGWRGAAGGEHRTVDDIAVTADIRVGIGGGEILKILPVRCRRASVQQSRPCKEP